MTQCCRDTEEAIKCPVCGKYFIPLDEGQIWRMKCSECGVLIRYNPWKQIWVKDGI